MLTNTHTATCSLMRNSLHCFRLMFQRNASSSDGKMMNKLLSHSRKSKKVWYKSNVGANPTFEELVKQTTKNNAGRQSTKRVNVLNKLIMKNITDLMATGENSDRLVGYGLEISKVSISGDYRSVNVYWMARKSENDSELDELLHSISGLLRHELSRLRIMGEIPKIQFVKDKTYSNISAVERLLNEADFGEDFVPSCSTLLHNHPTIFTKIDDETKSKIRELENSENQDEEEIIPEMKMDVMGLDHSVIMTKLTGAILKSKALHRQSNAVQNVVKNTVSESAEKPQYLSFTDFVKKRKIQEAKAVNKRRSRSIENEMYDREVASINNDYDETENLNMDDYPLKL